MSIGFDLSPAVSALAFDQINVTRGSTGFYSAGIYQPGGTSPFLMLASVTQARGKDLDRLPEGQRSRAAIAIVASQILLTADRSMSVPADLISWNGVSYQVEHVEDWSAFGFYRAIAAQVEP